MSDRTGGAFDGRLDALSSSTLLGQYVSVGAVGTVVDNAVLYALVEVAVLGPIAAKVVAWELAIVVIFAINERWTFARYGAAGAPALGRRFLRSNGVRLGGFAVTMAVYASLVHVFDVWYLVANVVGIAIGFVVNYTFETLYIWRVHRETR